MQMREGHQHSQDLLVVRTDTSPVLLNHWLFLTDNPWIIHLKIHCVQFLLWDYSNDPLQASYSWRQATNAQQHLPGGALRTNPLWMPPHLIVAKNQIFQTVLFQMLMEMGKSKSVCTHRYVFVNIYMLKCMPCLACEHQKPQQSRYFFFSQCI